MRIKQIVSKITAITMLLMICSTETALADIAPIGTYKIEESIQKDIESKLNVKKNENITNATTTTNSNIIVVDRTSIENTVSTEKGYGGKNNGYGTVADWENYGKQQAVKDNSLAWSEVKASLQECGAYSTYSDTELTGLAWCIAQEIVTMKKLGFSLEAAQGVLVNMKTESGYNPYSIEGWLGNKTYDMFVSDSNLTLTINGQSPYADETGASGESQLTSPSRITLDVSSIAPAPTKGIGLIQFTDFGTKNTFRALKHGLRRSNAIYSWTDLGSDPWAAVLKTKPFSYKKPKTTLESTMTYSVYDEATGEKTEMEVYTAPDEQELEDAQSQDRLVMAPVDIQLLFIDAEDGPNCWGIGNDGKKTLPSLGLKAEGFGYEDYKKGGFTTAQAAAYWCAYTERPKDGEVQRRYNAATTEAGIKTVCSLASKYYGGSINLDTMVDYGTNPMSSVAGTESQGSIYSGANLQSHNVHLAKSGYLSESQCSDIMVQAEGQVTQELLDLAQRSYLNQQELNALVDWENEVKVNSFENTLVLLGRRIVLFLGIIVMIWSILLYFAYWFDRLNTVVFVDLLGKLSFGHLCMADCAENSTYFNKREGQKVKTKTVAHRDILLITCIGFAISTVMVTGLLFKWLYWVVMKIFNFLQ